MLTLILLASLQQPQMCSTITAQDVAHYLQLWKRAYVGRPGAMDEIVKLDKEWQACEQRELAERVRRNQQP